MAAHSYLAHLITERLLPGGGRILDIGAGPCDKLAVLARMGYRCDAFDDFGDAWHQIGDNLDRIRTFARTFGISLHEGNVNSVLPGLGRFDLVMLSDIIEHLH